MTANYISAVTMRNILRAYRRGRIGLVALSEATRARDSIVTSVRWLVRPTS